MSNLEFDLDSIVYEEYDISEIDRFNELGKSVERNDDIKKEYIRSTLAKDNFKKIRDEFYLELDEEEFEEVSFIGKNTAVQYLASMVFSAEYQVAQMFGMDVGTRFVVYATRKKVCIYEVDGIANVKRRFIIEYSDIEKFYFKEKRDEIILCFKVDKDKYNNMRMCSSWILYWYIQNRINISIRSGDRKEIAEFFQNRINEKND